MVGSVPSYVNAEVEAPCELFSVVMVPVFKIPMLFTNAEIVPVFVIVVIVPVLEIPKSLAADIVPEFVIVPIIPPVSSPLLFPEDIVPELIIVPIVPLPPPLLTIPRLPSAEIVPVFVRILMVPPFRNPSIPPAVIIPLFISSSICPPEVRKLLFVVTEIVPLLVMVALVEPPAATAPVPRLSIVTLEPFPPIFKSEHLVVIIT